MMLMHRRNDVTSASVCAYCCVCRKKGALLTHTSTHSGSSVFPLSSCQRVRIDKDALDLCPPSIPAHLMSVFTLSCSQGVRITPHMRLTAPGFWLCIILPVFTAGIHCCATPQVMTYNSIYTCVHVCICSVNYLLLLYSHRFVYASLNQNTDTEQSIGPLI